MRKYKMESTVGVFVILGLLCVGYLTMKLGNVSFLGKSYYPVYARFTSVSGLRTGNTVEMLGIEVGSVGNLVIDQKDQLAVVELRLKKGIKVYDDAIASIRTTGLIGDKYVQIDPGGAGNLLKEGGTIIETEPSVNIGDILGKYAFGEVKK